MEFVILATDSLIEWDKNDDIRSITPENFESLRLKLQNKPQYEPLFVTPNTNGTFTVIAGNHRLRAYRALGVPELWCRIIDVKTDEGDGSFYRVLDGIPESEHFQTTDDALMDFAVSHNERFAQYDLGKFANIDGVYNLNWDNYNMDAFKPQKPSEILKKFGIETDPTNETATEEPPTNKKTQTLAICPQCANEFYI